MARSSRGLRGSTRTKRILKELQDITSDPPCLCKAYPAEEDTLEVWLAEMEGPPDTPYQGGLFYLKIVFPNDYPFKPPKVTFTTKIYHVNVDRSGVICLDTLKSGWSPAFTIGKVLLSISSLLSSPNPKDPMLPELGKQYRNDFDKYMLTAKTWTKRFATRSKT
mmetsp:Transcript_9900/g.27808  ORF Transcript_9900/g.27808 Transcript_9900/m.27808 type:complete len:164 (-) Transcript_9900:1181-1672(-)